MNNMFLVLGANGYIGSYIYNRLCEEGYASYGTVRSMDNISASTINNNNLIEYDILNDERDTLLRRINTICRATHSENNAASDMFTKTAIFGIAISNINECHEEYSKAQKINIDKTRECISLLVKNGYKVIWFSSDNVYDGVKGNYTEDDNPCPINCYGQMKADVEDYLLANEPSVCIMRLSKVVDYRPAKQNIFTEWERQINNNELIKCIKGNKLSFVALEDVYQACKIIAEKNMSGLFNIVGDKNYSRKELADMFIDRIWGGYKHITECDVNEFSFKDKRPLDLSMINNKFKSQTDYLFTSMNDIIEKYHVRALN